MMIRRTIVGFICAIVACAMPVLASGNQNRDSDAALKSAIERLDHDASVDAEGPSLLAGLIEKEYGTSEDELKWGVAQKLSWGEITTLAYIQATTGKSFAEMNREEARRNFWS